VLKSKVLIFILLALAALVLQLVVGQRKPGGQRCCPRTPDFLMGLPAKNSPDSNH
jgi:hypothetical protein